MNDSRPEPRQGFLRLSSILAPVGPLPISKSQFWKLVREDKLLKPYKLGPRTTIFKKADIDELCARIERGDLS